jgi:hypothetical protein
MSSSLSSEPWSLARITLFFFLLWLLPASAISFQW